MSLYISFYPQFFWTLQFLLLYFLPQIHSLSGCHSPSLHCAHFTSFLPCCLTKLHTDTKSLLSFLSNFLFKSVHDDTVALVDATTLSLSLSTCIIDIVLVIIINNSSRRHRRSSTSSISPVCSIHNQGNCSKYIAHNKTQFILLCMKIMLGIIVLFFAPSSWGWFHLIFQLLSRHHKSICVRSTKNTKSRRETDGPREK